MLTDDDRSAPPVRLEDASVSIEGRPVVRGVDLEVPRGQFLALMGANGSGKSTLVRAMTGLRPLSRGRAELFGVPVQEFKDRHRVGFVPQRAGAASGVPASVWEVVAAGRLARRRLLRPLGRADRRAVEEAVAAVGLSHLSDVGVSTLSGGQQQRTLIARALAGEPELFFLDEPTAGVDLPNQEALARTLAMLTGRGATIVLVAHELGPLAGLVDRSVVLKDGRVVYDGPALADHEVHAPHLGEGHTHQHHDQPEPDHAPSVALDLDPYADPAEDER